MLKTILRLADKKFRGRQGRSTVLRDIARHAFVDGDEGYIDDVMYASRGMWACRLLLGRS